MSCTLIHSRTEWYSCPPVKTFGVGRPISVSTATVRAAADDSSFGSTPARRVASSAASTTRGTLVVGPHVAVLRRASMTLARGRVLRSRCASVARAPRLLLELLVVVVTGDEVDDRLLGAAGDPRDERPLTLLGRLGRQPSAAGSSDEAAASLTGLTSLPFAVPGGRDRPRKVTLHSSRRECLVLDLADRRSVEGVGDVCAECVQVEVLGAVADLLVDREPDPDGLVCDLGMGDEVRDRGHDLRDPGLVVGPEERRSVAGDDVVADPGGSWNCSGGVPGRVPGIDRRSVPGSCTIGETLAPGASGDVSTWASSPTAGASSARKPREHR